MGRVRSEKLRRFYGKDQICESLDYDFDESDVVLGLDFGTSFSKVVIQDNALQKAYAVSFEDIDRGKETYLLPTRLFVTEEGLLSLSSGFDFYIDFKTAVMEMAGRKISSVMNKLESFAPTELATAYLALLIRYARSWFLVHTESVYRKTLINWDLNIGIASKNYRTSKERVFRTIAFAAWKLSRSSEPLTMAMVQNTLAEAVIHMAAEILFKIIGKNARKKDFGAQWLHTENVQVHPEVIAEVAGYVHSPMRRNGMHFLVDIGGSTVDMATFMIHENDGDNHYPILATDVVKYGTMMLHKNRMNHLKEEYGVDLFASQFFEDHFPGSEYYADLLRRKGFVFFEEDDFIEKMNKSDMQFWKQCSAKIGELIKYTYKDRYGYAPEWKKGLPVFICGGGARVVLYRDGIHERGERIAANGMGKFHVYSIPVPSGFKEQGLVPKEYERLAVAYGLSFTSENIGKIIPQSQVKDMPRRSVFQERDSDFIGKEYC
ncbi:hypothetical protein LZ24_01159 [Desulfobotulus alkaliphilus]|uniref:Uncharacterized protein n=1 Tax=Desulfobotulus alkaliphilus TaxID=622671 RepID=A0A562S0C3_9BACT|nr:hypothetical protein [Desulfobotulus alkaliphilus]TWI73930.1 hypothetical protein LZ24_01159 [Desulfobotulus alkaliphilus]